MKFFLIGRVLAGFILTSSWCLFFVLLIGRSFLIRIEKQELRWSDSHAGSTASEITGNVAPVLIALIALSLIALQIVALIFRSRLAAKIAGVAMLLIGLPMLLAPLPDRDIYLSNADRYLMFAIHGSFLFGGATMLGWSCHISTNDLNKQIVEVKCSPKSDPDGMRARDTNK